MKFKNKTNSYSLWIEEAKTMIVWGDKGIADVTDKRAIKYLQEHGRGDKFKEMKADEGAVYERVIKIDASKLEPVVSCPHTVDNVKKAKALADVKINQIYIGTCTNGRIEDLRTAAAILKGKRVADGVRLFVTPASRDVMLQALKEGLIEIFVQSGASVQTPGCGPCSASLLPWIITWMWR